MLEARDAAQGRGLAAARGPEQDHDLAGRHGKADAVDRRPADRKLLAQIGNLERRRHDFDRLTRETIIAGTRKSCPIRQPTARAASHTGRSSGTTPSPPWDRSPRDRPAAPSMKSDCRDP